MRKFLASRGAMSAFVVLVAAALLIGGVAFKGLTTKTTAYCAELDNSVGLFTGSKVAQFGYPIGEVTKITPNGATRSESSTVIAGRRMHSSEMFMCAPAPPRRR